MTDPDLSPFQARVLAVAHSVAGGGWFPTHRRLYHALRRCHPHRVIISADVREARLALRRRGLLPDPARTGGAR